MSLRLSSCAALFAAMVAGCAPEPKPAAAPVVANTAQLSDFAMFKDCADVCPDMIVIPEGVFLMGSPLTEAGRGTEEGEPRTVRVERFAIGRFEVTFAQWDACATERGCRVKEDDGAGRGERPVFHVSWDDAKTYVDWLARKTGARYRLPSESEWEYAARAGATAPFSTGQSLSKGQANFGAVIDNQSIPQGWMRPRPLRVGLYPPNPWRLYDMHGNVSEWVEDCNDDKNALNCIQRGGNYFSRPDQVRSAARKVVPRHVVDAGFATGFRVARDLAGDRESTRTGRSDAEGASSSHVEKAAWAG